MYFRELRNNFLGVKIIKFFNADLGSGMEKIWIQDPGWKKFGSGIKIPNPQHSKGLKSLQLMTEINNGLNQTCRFRAEAPSVPSMFVISKEGMVITYRGKETMQKENFT
jgi:hypothetical protein